MVDSSNIQFKMMKRLNRRYKLTKLVLLRNILLSKATCVPNKMWIYCVFVPQKQFHERHMFSGRSTSIMWVTKRQLSIPKIFSFQSYWCFKQLFFGLNNFHNFHLNAVSFTIHLHLHKYLNVIQLQIVETLCER